MFNFRLSRIHKEGREETVCEPTTVPEQETMTLNRSITKTVSLVSKNENLKKTFPTTSACKGIQHGFGTSSSSLVYGKIPKMTESVGIKDKAFFPHHCNNSFPSTCKYTVSSSAFLTKNTVSHEHSSFYFKCDLILYFLVFYWK